MDVAKQLYSTLNRLAETDVKMGRTSGFQYIDSRPVVCGSEHAFRIPRGFSTRQIENAIDTLIAAVGAPVELIDRGGAVIVRVVETDLPKVIRPRLADVKPDRLLIGYNRLQQPIYHPLNAHILCGGASNAGKTDGLRWWLYQLHHQGYDIRIADLKGFSFFPFERLPRVRIAKTLPEAHDMLIESVVELEERKERVIRSRSRDIIRTFQPVVFVIDEAAALAPKQNSGRSRKLAESCDEAIAYFGQQAREPQMVMLYCTQRPSVDVINLQFRANVEAMIAFRTRDKENSRLIIGKEGAERISPTTPGRCIYAYDRDHTLQVPYVGGDSEWDAFLKPLRTEVIEGGSSKRAETPRQYIDGVIAGSSSNNAAVSGTERRARSAEESVGPVTGNGGRRARPVGISRQGKDMGSNARGAQANRMYTDSIE